MSTDPDQAGAGHWSTYWAHGSLTSLPQDFRENYDGEIAAFWTRQFDELPNGARVLDVCTGNGAVALLAAAHARANQRRYAITGIDAARIDPETIRARHPALADDLGDIEFLGECRFESFNPRGPGFDLVASQYGIEYCNWESAAERVATLLRPGGRLALVSHAASSAILKTMEAENLEYETLHRLGLLPVLQAWADERIGAARLKAELSRGLPQLRQRLADTGSSLYGYVLKLGNRLLQTSDDELDRRPKAFILAQRELRDAGVRLADLLRVNRAIIDAPDWTEAFLRHGLEALESGSLHYTNQAGAARQPGADEGTGHRAGQFHVFRKPS